MKKQPSFHSGGEAFFVQLDEVWNSQKDIEQKTQEKAQPGTVEPEVATKDPTNDSQQPRKLVNPSDQTGSGFFEIREQDAAQLEKIWAQRDQRNLSSLFEELQKLVKPASVEEILPAKYEYIDIDGNRSFVDPNIQYQETTQEKTQPSQEKTQPSQEKTQPGQEKTQDSSRRPQSLGSKIEELLSKLVEILGSDRFFSAYSALKCPEGSKNALELLDNSGADPNAMLDQIKQLIAWEREYY